MDDRVGDCSLLRQAVKDFEQLVTQVICKITRNNLHIKAGENCPMLEFWKNMFMGVKYVLSYYMVITMFLFDDQMPMLTYTCIFPSFLETSLLTLQIKCAILELALLFCFHHLEI